MNAPIYHVKYLERAIPMNMKNLLISTGIISVLAIAYGLSSQNTTAEVATSVKPQGAMGMGKVAPMQAKNNQFWWPDQLDLSALRDHDARSNPHGANFDYAKEFKKLDMAAVKKDIDSLLTTSQDWWRFSSV